MYENSEQYTANSILVLHVLQCIGEPVSDYHFTELMMGPGLVNYFTIEQCLSQMIENGFVERSLDSMGVAMYSLTESGASLLDSMKYMLSGGLGACYAAYVKAHAKEIRQQMRIDANCFEDSKNNLYVRCFVRDGLMCLVDVTLPVATKEDADKICREWRTNPSNLYVKLIQALYEGAKIIQED